MAPHGSISPHHFFPSKSGCLRRWGPDKVSPLLLSDVLGVQGFSTTTSKVIDYMSYFLGSGGEYAKQKQNQTPPPASRPQTDCVHNFRTLTTGTGTGPVLLAQFVWCHPKMHVSIYVPKVLFGSQWGNFLEDDKLEGGEETQFIGNDGSGSVSTSNVIQGCSLIFEWYVLTDEIMFWYRAGLALWPHNE